MAELVLQDGSAGLAEVTFASADGCGDQVPSGANSGGWRKDFILFVKNNGCSSATVYVNVTGHDECNCCEPIASQEFEVEADKMSYIPITHARLGELVTIEYSSASDLEVAVVTSLEGFIVPVLEECCC